MGIAALLLLLAQQATFDVASLKPSPRAVGPDYNNRIVFQPNGIRARNVTPRRLIAEAYGLQLNQVIGPVWLDREEFDLEARTSGTQVARMLQTLLAERFGLKAHRETRRQQVYELVVDKDGPKLRPSETGMTARRFADLLAVQLTIVIPDDPTRPARATESPVPVLDRTGLTGTYDFRSGIGPEPGGDAFVLWQEALHDRFGLKLIRRKANVEVLVVDAANRIPSGN
ncbi:MAG: TIGR03435 family protein [Acidobacteriota bacterium]|nr:TIGR03435 family protein [Acidobacteriota bacterium]